MKLFVPPLLVLVCLGVMVLLDSYWRIYVFLRPPWTYLGLVPIAASIALGLWAFVGLLRAKTTVKPFRQASALVTTGAYRISRHPIYLAYALGLLGACIMMGVVANLLVVAAFVVAAELLYVRPEERVLARKFGDEFKAYSARTPQWL